MPKIEELKNNLEDIQGNVIRGYGPFFAHYRFYHLKNQESGRAWLQEFLKKRPAGDPLEQLKITNSKIWSNGERPSFTVNIAFSHRGLEQLGLPQEVLNSFPLEFQEGMRKRAVTFLGDASKGSSGEDRNIPKHWDDLFLQEGDEKTIHALVIVTGKTEAQKEEGLECLKTLEQTFPGVPVLGSIDGKRRPEPHDRKEHFGFTDGISQPFIEGSEAVFDGKGAVPGQGTPDEKVGKWRNLKPGEFILGYEDEFGEVADSPTHYDLRKNGTYLVLRQLQQKVKAFDDFCLKAAQELWPSDFNHKPQHYKSLVRAKFMGRWPSGCPITLSPHADDKELAKDRMKNNSFLFNKPFPFLHQQPNGSTPPIEETIEDKDGARCPLGAHIRRTNPRDHMLLAPKDIFDKENSYDYHLNRHRIIRRGLTYGDEYTGANNDDDNRGVIFMALNASISRQFEFIQQHWVNHGEHVGQDKTNRDPIIGKKDDGKAKMTVQGAENPFVYDLAQFVVEKGGEYFFYPGLGALEKLADRAFAKRSSFLSDYEALESMSPSFRGNVALQKMVGRKWLTALAQEMFKELHNSSKKEHKVFQVPGIPPPQTLPDLGKPPIVIATKFPDVMKILKNEKQSFNAIPPFSVALYARKMEPPRGPFALGLEYFMEKYVKEIQILRDVVYPTGDVGQTIYDTVERLANEEMNKHKGKGKIDVIGDLVWPVALRLNGEYFGVPGPGPGEELETIKRWSRDIYTDLFLNLRNNRNWTRLADIAVEEMNDYLTDLIEAKRKELKAFPHAPETVLTRMIKRQEGSSDGFEDGWDGVRRNMFGMVIGVVETTLKAVPRTIDQLLNLDPENELKKTREAALEYKYKHDPQDFKKYVWEAMRFNPQNHVLFRLAIDDFKLGEGKPWETGTIKASPEAPVLVFAGNLSAMFDPDTVSEPDTYKIDRPDEHYIFFGHGPHECLGKQISEIQIPLLVKNILILEGLKRAADSQFDPRDLRPKHFFLEFNAHPASPGS